MYTIMAWGTNDCSTSETDIVTMAACNTWPWSLRKKLVHSERSPDWSAFYHLTRACHPYQIQFRSVISMQVLAWSNYLKCQNITSKCTSLQNLQASTCVRSDSCCSKSWLAGALKSALQSRGCAVHMWDFWVRVKQMSAVSNGCELKSS